MMKINRFAPSAPLLAIGLSCLIVALACNDGSGDSMTLEEYFSELERIGRETQLEIGAINTPEVDRSSAATYRDTLVEYFSDYLRVSGEALDRIEQLHPPDAIAHEHEVFVSALQEVMVYTSSGREDLRAVDSTDELRTALVDFRGAEYAAVRDAVTDACEGVQGVAEANQISIDLHCQEIQ